MHYQAIFTMGMLGLNKHLKILFPNPFIDLVSEQSQKYSLEESLIFAIMRRESLFYRKAESPVGAKGLMQVTNSTANFISKRYKLNSFDDQQIYNSTVNIKIGSANLNFLMGLFKNNLILSIAAYNAGPGSVAKWLSKREVLATIWIENIPFVETRNYVRYVLVNMVIYDNLVLKSNNERLSDLLRIELSNKFSFKK
ncbi:lytic transglycosylase domain-containing protein [Francisella sp. SYW-9]|uniref:lytic transglycosylase domain-containing protein n=1 Tax=Francisella sp. SYW-9 TaxID=2610888 RepID=UPI00123CEF5A|nr:lytic transglycosylase domain-containing protein [Francisella sp. SYW-9]